MTDGSYEPARFLNVDLVVDSRSRLDPLVSGIEGRAVVLYHGRFGSHWRAVFELPPPMEGRGPNVAIRRFAALVNRVPGSAGAAWTRASRRTFDIGIQGGLGRNPFELGVGAAVLRLAAELGAGIQITVYEPVRITAGGLDTLGRREAKRAARPRKRTRTRR